MAGFSTEERLRLYGLPGEGQKAHVLFQVEGQTREQVGRTSQGFYRVDFLLARPHSAKFTDERVSFIKNEVGDSHLKIAKPLFERRPDVSDRPLWRR